MSATIKVLMVDDDKEDYIIAREILNANPEETKYIVDWVSEYDEALDLILKKEHDVFLVDYMIGINNGLDLIKEVRSKGCSAPLILLTGQRHPEIDAQAMLVGASDFVTKGRNNSGEILERAIRYEIRNCENLRKIQNLNLELENKVKERTLKLSETVQILAQANVTLSKTLEEKTRVEQALIESQKLYTVMAKNFPSGMIGILNREFDFIFSEGAERNSIFGPAENKAGGSFFSLIPRENLDVINNYLRQALEGIPSAFEIEHPDKIYAVNLEPVFDHNHSVKMLVVVMLNVTAQKEVEIKIRKALKKEIELNELKSRFVSMASHEFRTPLGAITTSLSLLEKYLPEIDDKSFKHIKRIRLSAKHLLDILTEFLSIDKLEQGIIEKSNEYFNLKILAGEVIDGLEGYMKEGQSINFAFNGDENIPCDKRILYNILLNLLSNASKYSEANSKIDLSVEVANQNVKLQVQDCGIGIPEEDKAMVFSRFFRAQNAVNIQGTGLGLNIVKRYVELLDGTIGFDSKLNEGTLFTVNFPISELVEGVQK